MNIIAFIEQEAVIKKLLKHLELWNVQTRPPPRIHSPPAAYFTDYGSTVFDPVLGSVVSGTAS